MNQIKIAIVILAGTESNESLARLVNALEAAKEFKQAGDQIQILFDGAGVTWIRELADPKHHYHSLFESVRDNVSGVCDYCAGAFGVRELIPACNLPLSSEFEGHPSMRQLITSGFQIITY